MTVHAVVFDVGNVLYRWSLRAMFAKRIRDVDDLDWFLGNVVTQEWHFQHNAGRPIAEMVAERKTEFPDFASLIDDYANHFNESICAPVKGSLEIVDALSKRHVPIFGITNFGNYPLASVTARGGIEPRSSRSGGCNAKQHDCLNRGGGVVRD